MREFIRNHFEEFVNRKNVRIGDVNFAPAFVNHGADVPAGMPPGPAGAIQYVAAALKKVPDLHVSIERHDCRRRQSGGAQLLNGYGCGFAGAAGILRNRDLADRQPANCGALGLLGESAPAAQLNLEN
jgi:hypothetical protein